MKNSKIDQGKKDPECQIFNGGERNRQAVILSWMVSKVQKKKK